MQSFMSVADNLINLTKMSEFWAIHRVMDFLGLLGDFGEAFWGRKELMSK